ncbi:MAG: hypothetical protein KC994_27300, partial [Candidatus Omnitrophica bacterium]|nr:hypothetical protein [Candidatus Omnitrophota bacterium]
MSSLRTYLALGDSMSIDFYTRVRGGGATSQLHRRLGAGWMLDDRTEDGCVIARAPRDGHGHLITLTVGGNDLRVRAQEILEDRFAAFRDAHLALLRAVRQAN